MRLLLLASLVVEASTQRISAGTLKSTVLGLMLLETFVGESLGDMGGICSDRGVLRQKCNCTRNDVIISLATLPGREAHLRLTLESLLLQTVQVPILVVVPYAFLRFPDARYEIPEWLQNTKGVRVLRCDDRGPVSKLVCPLEEAQCEEGSQRTGQAPGLQRFQQKGDHIVITVDDDCIYHPRMIENLLNYSDLYPDAAIAYAGHRLATHPLEMPNLWYVRLPHHKKRTGSGVPQPVHVDVLHGYMGALYRRKFLQPADLLSYGDLEDDARWIDDQWISGCLAQHNVSIIIIPSPEPLLVHLEVPEHTALTTHAREQNIIRSEGNLLRRFVRNGWMHLRPAGFVPEQRTWKSVYPAFGDACNHFAGGYKLVGGEFKGVDDEYNSADGGYDNYVPGRPQISADQKRVEGGVSLVFPVHGSLLRCSVFEKEIEIWVQLADGTDAHDVKLELSVFPDEEKVLESGLWASVMLGHGIMIQNMPFPRHEGVVTARLDLLLNDQHVQSIMFARETAPDVHTGCERHILRGSEVWDIGDEGYSRFEKGRDGVEGAALALATDLGVSGLCVRVGRVEDREATSRMLGGGEMGNEGGKSGSVGQGGSSLGRVADILGVHIGMQVLAWGLEEIHERMDTLTQEESSLFDVLSVSDVQGLDWHVVHAVLHQGARPCLIIAALNPWIELDKDWVVKLESVHTLLAVENGYYGAGMKAWLMLAQNYGYSLVHVDAGGRAVFLVLDEMVEFLNFEDVSCVNDLEVLFGLVVYRKCDGEIGGFEWSKASRLIDQ